MRKLTTDHKERLRKARQEAYLKMKDTRDRDPGYLALKEARKKKRKDAFQEIKKRRAGEKEGRQAAERKNRDEQLLAMMTKASDMPPKRRT